MNKFGSGISGAHAGMTAEGDNSVLMQKVAKEVLDLVRGGQYKLVTPTKPDSYDLNKNGTGKPN